MTTPLSERALLVTLSLGLPPMSKKDARITQEIRHRHGTDKIRASKTLLPEQAIQPLQKVQKDAYEYHRKNTVAWGEEARLLASGHFMEYSARLGDLRTRFDGLADEFTRDYPLYVDAARTMLNGAFNADDYPSQSVIRGRFRMELQFAPVPDAGDFRISLMREAMDELRDGLNARIEDATAAARNDLAARIASPLAAMVERLSQPDAVFRDTLVENLREICDLIPALNVTGDPELEVVRTRIRTELYTASPDLLRENGLVRRNTARKAQNILDLMNDYIAGGEPMAVAA